jgi:hypothetical protein
MPDKEITKQQAVTKLVKWMMAERHDALPEFRTFSAWEIKRELEDLGGSKSWWGRDLKDALRNELETYYDDLYLGYLGPQVGYILTSDKTIAAGLIPALLSIAEGVAETLRGETLSAEQQARLDGVVRALTENGRGVEDLRRGAVPGIPDTTIHKLEGREKLLMSPMDERDAA